MVDEPARQHGVATLTLAFSSDPVVRWAWPDSERYLSYWPPFVEAFGGRAFEEGTAHGLEDHVAVAHATVLLESLGIPESVGAMAATAEIEDEVDVVVKTLVGERRDVSALGRKVPPFDTDDLT